MKYLVMSVRGQGRVLADGVMNEVVVIVEPVVIGVQGAALALASRMSDNTVLSPTE